MNVINASNYFIYAWNYLEQRELRLKKNIYRNTEGKKGDPSHVSETKNCELRIFFVTLRLTLEFWDIITNAFLKNDKH